MTEFIKQKELCELISAARPAVEKCVEEFQKFNQACSQFSKSKQDRPEDIINDWDSLNADATANLTPAGLKAFLKYKALLRLDGHQWDDDAEDILRGFIWDESEAEPDTD